jgi:hypothetical protein
MKQMIVCCGAARRITGFPEADAGKSTDETRKTT